MVVEGERVPGFTLEADDGRQVSLKDFLGKKLVLIFILKTILRGVLRRLLSLGMLLKSLRSRAL